MRVNKERRMSECQRWDDQRSMTHSNMRPSSVVTVRVNSPCISGKCAEGSSTVSTSSQTTTSPAEIDTVMYSTSAGKVSSMYVFAYHPVMNTREGAPGRLDGFPGMEIGAPGGETGGFGSPAIPENAMQQAAIAKRCFKQRMITLVDISHKVTMQYRETPHLYHKFIWQPNKRKTL